MAYRYVLLYLALQFTPISSASLRQVQASRPAMEEAIDRLREVFEIDEMPPPLPHRTPPEYMVDLYESIAEPVSGITKASGPFNSDVIRGLVDKDTSHQMHFQFNVSFIKPHERILETEFHLFKLRPRFTGRIWRLMMNDSRPAHLVEISIYQVLRQDPSENYRPEDLKLLDFRRLATHAHGWQVFRIGEAVADWLNGTRPNYGLLVRAYSLNGRPVNGTIVRFAQRDQHHDRKQPVLVVFSADGRKRRSHINVEKAEFERRVQMMNEANWAFDDEEEDEEYHYLSRRKRSKPATPSDPNRRNHKICNRRRMYVDFQKIGWTEWVISPAGYHANQCKGECLFPLGQNQAPTNHATVQSIVHALQLVKGVNPPCCVPDKFMTVSMLYYDSSNNVVLKQYEDMVAEACACH